MFTRANANVSAPILSVDSAEAAKDRPVIRRYYSAQNHACQFYALTVAISPT